MPSRLIAAASAAVLAGILVACAAESGHSPSPGSSAAPTTSASAGSSSAPSASAGLTNLASFGGAGSYFYDGWLHFEFSVGDSWLAAHTGPDYWDIVRGTGSAATGAFSAGQFDGHIFGDACAGPGSETRIDATAQAFMAHLQTVAALNVGPTSAVSVAGYAGLTAAVNASGCNNGRIYLWILPTTLDFHIFSGEKAQITAINVGDGAVIFVAEDLGTNTDYSGFIDATSRIQAGMTITAP